MNPTAFPPPPGFVFRGLEVHRSDLVRFLRARCRDLTEVEDIVQESFMRAARYRSSLDSDGSLRPWLLRIATNVLADRLTQQRRRTERNVSDTDLFELEGREPEPIEAIADEELWVAGRMRPRAVLIAALQRVVDTLDAIDRKLVLAYYADRDEGRRLAGELGIPPDRLKVRLFRLRKRMRRELQRLLCLGEVEGELRCAGTAQAGTQGSRTRHSRTRRAGSQHGAKPRGAARRAAQVEGVLGECGALGVQRGAA